MSREIELTWLTACWARWLSSEDFNDLLRSETRKHKTLIFIHNWVSVTTPSLSTWFMIHYSKLCHNLETNCQSPEDRGVEGLVTVTVEWNVSIELKYYLQQDKIKISRSLPLTIHNRSRNTIFQSSLSLLVSPSSIKNRIIHTKKPHHFAPSNFLL